MAASTINNFSGNWYGQIVDRQAGGALPPAGTNLKNFTCNWFGTATPVVTTANSRTWLCRTDPGYYGGSATAPGGQPDIAGPASANFTYLPRLSIGTDNPTETTPGWGTYGFQPSQACSLHVQRSHQRQVLRHLIALLLIQVRQQ